MARMRSPNFPGLSLEDAVKFVKPVWDQNRRVLISREVAAKDLGYTGLTGRSLKVLGAMNQYGLIENKAGGQMRVSKLAEDILIGYPEAVKRAAVSEAGRTPSLFREIYERFEDHVPSENAVRSFLLQKGFTNAGVEKALRSFSETNRYVEIYGVSESHGGEEAEGAESGPDNEKQETPIVASPAPRQEAKPSGGQGGGEIFWNRGPLDYSLSSSGLVVVGKTNSARELREYIEKLNVLAGILPDEDPSVTDNSS
jgi:hypothetical protein